MNNKGNIRIVLAIIIILGLGIFLWTLSRSIKKQNINEPQNTEVTIVDNPSDTPSSPTPQKFDYTTLDITYKNPMYPLQFSYPKDWKITFDKQPDPTGNPSKYSITLANSATENISITILNSPQYKTFESLSNILNLPSGPAKITSSEEIVVGGQRALYIVQSNAMEGFILIDLKGNMVVFETQSSNKNSLKTIIPTISL